MYTNGTSKTNASDQIVSSNELNIQNLKDGKESGFNHETNTNNHKIEKRKRHSTFHTSGLGISNSDFPNKDIIIIEENSIINSEEISPTKHKNKKNSKYKKKDLVENYSAANNMQSEDASVKNTNDKIVASNAPNIHNVKVGKEKEFNRETHTITSYSEIDNPKISKRIKHSSSVYTSDLGISNSDIQNHDYTNIEEKSRSSIEIPPIKCRKKKYKKNKNNDLVEKYSAVSHLSTDDPSKTNANNQIVSSKLNIHNLDVGKESEFNHEAYTIPCISRNVYNLKIERTKRLSTFHTSGLVTSNSDFPNKDSTIIEENSIINSEEISPIKHKRRKKRKHKKKDLVENYFAANNMQSEDPSVKSTNDKIVLSNELNIQNLNIGKEFNCEPCIITSYSDIENPKISKLIKHSSSVYTSDLGISNYDNTNIEEKSRSSFEEIPPIKCRKKKYKKNKNNDLVEKYSAVSHMCADDPSKTNASNQIVSSNELNIQNLNAGKESKFNKEAYTIPCISRNIYNLKIEKRKRHSIFHASGLDISNSDLPNKDITIIEENSIINSEEISPIKHKRRKNRKRKKKDLVENYSAANSMQSEDPRVTYINSKIVLSNELNIQNLNVGKERKFNHEAHAITCYLEIDNPKIVKQIKDSSSVHSPDLFVVKSDVVHDRDIAIIEKKSNIYSKEISPIKHKIKKHKKDKKKFLIKNYSVDSNPQSEDLSVTNANDDIILSNELNIQNLNIRKEFNHEACTIPDNSRIVNNIKIRKKIRHSTVHTSDLSISNSDLQNSIAIIENNSNICEETSLIKRKKKHKNKGTVENSAVCNVQSKDPSLKNKNDKIILNNELNIQNLNDGKKGKFHHEVHTISCNSEIVDNLKIGKRKRHSTVYTSGLGISNSDLQNQGIVITEKKFNICEKESLSPKIKKRLKHFSPVHTSNLCISNSDIPNHDVTIFVKNVNICEEISPIKRKNKKYKKTGLLENHSTVFNLHSKDSNIKNTNDEIVLSNELNVEKEREFNHEEHISYHSEIYIPKIKTMMCFSSVDDTSDLGISNSDIQNHDISVIEKKCNIREEISPIKHKYKGLLENHSTVYNLHSKDPNVSNEIVSSNKLNIQNLNVGNGREFNHGVYTIPCNSGKANNLKMDKRRRHSTIHTSNLSILNADIQNDITTVEKNSNIHSEEISPKDKKKKHRKHKNKDLFENYSTVSNMESEDANVKNTNDKIVLSNEPNIQNLNIGEEKFNHEACTSFNSDNVDFLKIGKRKQNSAVHTSDLDISKSDIQTRIPVIEKNSNVCEEISPIKHKHKKHKNDKHKNKKRKKHKNDKHKNKKRKKHKNLVENYSTGSKMQLKDSSVTNIKDKIVLSNELNIPNLNVGKKRKFNHAAHTISCYSKIYNPKFCKKIKHSSSVHSSDFDHFKSNIQNHDIVIVKTPNIHHEAYTITCNSGKVDNLKIGKRKKHSTVHTSDFHLLNADIQNHDIAIIEKKSCIHSNGISPIKHKNKKLKKNINKTSAEKHSVNSKNPNITNINDKFNLSNDLNIQNVNVVESNAEFNHKACTISGHSKIDYSVENYISSDTFNLDPVDFEVPSLHKYETVCPLTKKQRKELISQGVTIKLGKFTLAEDEVVLHNFKEFTCKYGVSDPYELLGIGRYAADSNLVKFLKAKHFYVRLGKGLNDRSLNSIYKRARLLLHPSRIAGKAEEETVSSIRHLQTYIGRKWNKIGDTLGRSGENCLQTYRWHEDAISKGKWTAIEKESLIKAIQQITGSSDVSCDKIKNISWEQVAAHVPTRNYSQCRWYWANHLAWKSNSLKQNWNRTCYVKFIDILSKFFNVEHASLIDWKKIHKHFEDVSPSCMNLHKRWLYLKSRIPGYKTMSYKDIIKKLCEKYKVV